MAITALAAALAAQAENVTYLDPTGSSPSQKTAACIQYTGQTDLTNGWYVVDGNVGVEDRITVNGDVNLILKDNAKLAAYHGITVDVNNTTTNSLTVWAQSDGANRGKLEANGTSDGGAGIGGGYGGTCGTVTITGGTVTATGENSAGIGGGYQGDGGTVVIAGGTVTAAAGEGAQAVGKGRSGSTSGSISFYDDAVVFTNATSQTPVAVVKINRFRWMKRLVA